MSHQPPSSIHFHTAAEIPAILRFAGAPELADRFGLSASMLDDPDARVQLSLLHDLIEAAVEASGDDYFGLHLGAGISRGEFIGQLGVLGLLILSSPCIRIALDHAVRYQQMFNEGDRYAMHAEADEAHFRFIPCPPTRPAQVHTAEKTVAQVLSILRVMDPTLDVRAVHFAHAERPGSEEVTRVLGLTPVYEREFTAVVVANDDLESPIDGADPDIFSYLERDLRIRSGSLQPTSAGGPFTLQVHTAILEGLHSGHYSSSWVAKKLGCSSRTLQRRLAEDGTTISALVNEIRRARAETLLETDMAIGDIALILGFSASAPFVRAFRRWFGNSPSQWRRRSHERPEPRDLR